MAFWTTGYRLAEPNADLLTAVRVTRDDHMMPPRNSVDLGGRIVFDSEYVSLSLIAQVGIDFGLGPVPLLATRASK